MLEKLMNFIFATNYSLIFKRFNYIYLQSMFKLVVLSVALARPGIILPIERAITRMKKKVLKRVIS